jgi:hypothetical protein
MPSHFAISATRFLPLYSFSLRNWRFLNLVGAVPRFSKTLHDLLADSFGPLHGIVQALGDSSAPRAPRARDGVTVRRDSRRRRRVGVLVRRDLLTLGARGFDQIARLRQSVPHASFVEHFQVGDVDRASGLLPPILDRFPDRVEEPGRLASGMWLAYMPPPWVWTTSAQFDDPVGLRIGAAGRRSARSTSPRRRPPCRSRSKAFFLASSSAIGLGAFGPESEDVLADRRRGVDGGGSRSSRRAFL